MWNKIRNWLRVKLLSILRLPETYVAADICIHEPTAILVMRFHRYTGKLEVIADYYSQNKNYRAILNEVQAIAKKYNVQQDNVLCDRGWY